MFDPLEVRIEVSSYIKACEHRISAATMPGNVKFTADECRMINFYAEELSKVTETDATVTVPLHSRVLTHWHDGQSSKD